MGACASKGFRRNRRRRETGDGNEQCDATTSSNIYVNIDNLTTFHDVFTSPYVITIVALYDFEEQSQDDLAFITGDRMVVEEQEWTSNVNWVNAFNLRTRQHGLVPKNYVQDLQDDLQSRSAPYQGYSPRPRRQTSQSGHILQRLTRQILNPSPQMVHIQRDSAVHDFLAYLAQPDFEPRRRILVIFKGEEGVDQGGPTRDLATSILHHLQHNQVLEGPAGKMCLSHSLGALSRHEYLKAGQLVAFVLCHAAMTCPLFSDSVVRLLCAFPDRHLTLQYQHRHPRHSQDEDENRYLDKEEETGGLCVVDDVPDVQFRNKLKEIEESDFPCSLAEEIAEEIGYYDILNADKKSAFLNVACQYYLYHRCRSEIEQFKIGLDQFGVLDVFRKHPEEAQSVLSGSQAAALTADEVFQMFTIVWDGDDIESSERREVTSYEFQFFLQDCASGDCECSLQDVLYFLTGARSIPPGGFGTNATLRFAKVPYPQVSTCTLELTLPLSLPPNKTLKDVMILAVSSPEFAVA